MEKETENFNRNLKPYDAKATLNVILRKWQDNKQTSRPIKKPLPRIGFVYDPVGSSKQFLAHVTRECQPRILRSRQHVEMQDMESVLDQSLNVEPELTKSNLLDSDVKFIKDFEAEMQPLPKTREPPRQPKPQRSFKPLQNALKHEFLQKKKDRIEDEAGFPDTQNAQLEQLHDRVSCVKCHKRAPKTPKPTPLATPRTFDEWQKELGEDFFNNPDVERLLVKKQAALAGDSSKTNLAATLIEPTDTLIEPYNSVYFDEYKDFAGQDAVRSLAQHLRAPNISADARQALERAYDVLLRDHIDLKNPQTEPKSSYFN